MASVYTTLNDLQTVFSQDELNEPVVPTVGSTAWNKRARWFSRGQEYIFKKGWLKPFLKSTTFPLTTTSPNVYTLPSDYRRRNDMYAWLEPNAMDASIPPVNIANPTYQRVTLTPQFTNGQWTITRNPAPQSNEIVTVTLWYYAYPTALSGSSDVALIDGDLLIQYALWRYYKSTRQRAAAQDARDELNEMTVDFLTSQNVPMAGESLSLQSPLDSSGIYTSGQGQFYAGNAYINP